MIEFPCSFVHANHCYYCLWFLLHHCSTIISFKTIYVIITLPYFVEIMSDMKEQQQNMNKMIKFPVIFE